MKSVRKYLTLMNTQCVLHVERNMKMAGDIKGAIKASAIVAFIIAGLPILIAMTYDDFPRYCKQTILLPCIGVKDE